LLALLLDTVTGSDERDKTSAWALSDSGVATKTVLAAISDSSGRDDIVLKDPALSPSTTGGTKVVSVSEDNIPKGCVCGSERENKPLTDSATGDDAGGECGMLVRLMLGLKRISSALIITVDAAVVVVATPSLTCTVLERDGAGDMVAMVDRDVVAESRELGNTMPPVLNIRAPSATGTPLGAIFVSAALLGEEIQADSAKILDVAAITGPDLLLDIVGLSLDGS
jgi:hypothetical protein